MPTDTPRPATPALSFALRLIAWSLALFGVLRLAWVGAHILLPATRLQAAAGAALVGPSTLPIEATLACSGADALALCLATILAYPARWRMRAAGIAGGVFVLLALNILRIGTLGRAAAFPQVFDVLHVYVWPAILTVAIAGYVFSWTRIADGRQGSLRVDLRFALLAGAGLVAFILASPLYLQSARVLVLAGFVADTAAILLRSIGVDATASAGMLATPHGAFQVTQECLATPLIPVYLAAAWVYARGWRTKALWIAAGVPVFLALGIARLLVVAVPGLGVPPAFFIHTFSQLLVAAGVVAGVALWQFGARATTLARVALALGLAFGVGRWLGAPYTHAILWSSAPSPALEDPQGARLFLPAFQSALFIALWIAASFPGRFARFVYGAALLAGIQIAVAAAVNGLGVHAGFVPPVLAVRAWALLGPVMVFAVIVHGGRAIGDRPS